MTSIEGSEKTEIVYGSSNVLEREIQFFHKATLKVDTCMDYTRPSLAFGINSIRKSFLDAKKRGVKLRYITEIITENISYCKQLMNIAEVRHLDGIKGNFMVSDIEYLAPAVPNSSSDMASQIIYSDLKDIVEQQNYIFDTLWNKAIPAIKRIREIEEGVAPIGTRLLEDSDEIFNYMKHVIEDASKRLVCSSSGGMQLIYDNFFDQYKKILDKYRNGKGEGIRWIITIDKDNKELVKIFLNAGVQIRHLKNLIPMNFAVDDKHFHSTIEKMEGGRMMQSLLVSNELIYINHYRSIFEDLWKNGIDAVLRIKEIEEDTDLADIEVFQNASNARELYFQILKAATEEILLLFPTVNAFIRQKKIVQGSLLLSNAKKFRKKIKFRILMPFMQQIEPKITNFKRSFNDDVEIEIRYIESVMLTTQATILVTDRKKSMVMEIKDDSKMNFDEAIGLSTYSNSKAGVLSYVSIFENLWKQIELYEDIKKSHKQLMTHNKAQEEFINVAAHELRTPIQPILGLSDLLLHRKQTEKKQQELLEIVVRNAKRLERLTEDILDITRIESKTLKLKKELFNLCEMLQDSIADFQDQIDKEKKDTNQKLEFIGLEKDKDIIVEADRGRINQVISNLLSNAIKFTDKGKISVSIARLGDDIVVSVKDTGSGIDSKILLNLFAKFVTKSDRGTGLGLFISKNIIEAHGGNMWGKNNANEKGATFSFSLPSVGNSG